MDRPTAIPFVGNLIPTVYSYIMTFLKAICTGILINERENSKTQRQYYY